MRYAELGQTGITVSCLCYGTLALSEGHSVRTAEESFPLLKQAWDLGVNFYDTAEFYGTYKHLQRISSLPGAVISSRCYACSASDAQRSFDRMRRDIGLDAVDVFGLHEQESGLTLKGHGEALRYFSKMRNRGALRAVSVSTHYVECVRAAATMDEVDVIFAILNVDGLGIRGGAREDMEDALAFAKAQGKGVYLMKALGGGHLFRDPFRALAYARDFPHKDSVAVGLRDAFEIDYAAKVFCFEPPPGIPAHRSKAVRRLAVEDWCERCGKCIDKCPFGALQMGPTSVMVDPDKCLLCGYCAKVCPHFCLKVV